MDINKIQKSIPHDWANQKLGLIGLFAKGKGISKDQLSEVGYNAVRYGELYTKFDVKIERIYSYIPSKIIPSTREIKYGDILFAGSGETNDEIGKSAVYFLEERCYAGGDIIIFSPKNANSLFLSYFLNTGEARKRLRELGQGQSIVHIHKNDLENLEFNFPLLEEQNRIVRVLETWDSAIEKLGRKIEIKKRIKKGLMQELLTGKTRLPGFSGEWKIIKLGEIAKTSSGGTPRSNNPSYYIKGMIPWVNSGEVRKGKISVFENFITKEGLKKSSAKIFPKGTILIAMYGATAGQIGILEQEAATNQAICGVIPDKNYSSLFLYYFFTRKTKQLIQMASGAAQPNISQDIIRDFDVLLPSIDEQNSIAKIITAADDEIAGLERKMAIFKNQKKFLLNNLITGAIRTPTNL